MLNVGEVSELQMLRDLQADHSRWFTRDEFNRLQELAIRSSATSFHNGAALNIHQRFCFELVKIAKEHEGQKGEDIPEFMDMITAINVLELLYPFLIRD